MIDYEGEAQKLTERTGQKWEAANGSLVCVPKIGNHKLHLSPTGHNIDTLWVLSMDNLQRFFGPTPEDTFDHFIEWSNGIRDFLNGFNPIEGNTVESLGKITGSSWCVDKGDYLENRGLFTIVRISEGFGAICKGFQGEAISDTPERALLELCQKMVENQDKIRLCQEIAAKITSGENG